MKSFAKISTLQSEGNHMNQVYLFQSITVCLASILGCVYASLQANALRIWGIGLVFEVIYLFSVCFPGAYA